MVAYLVLTPSPPNVGSIILHFCSASNFGRARPDRPLAFLRRSSGLLLVCCRSSFEGDATYSYIIYMAVYIVCTYNIFMWHWRKRGYAAFTLIVGHQRQSCRVAYTHRSRNHFTGKQCYAVLIESATNIGWKSKITVKSYESKCWVDTFSTLIENRRNNLSLS